MLYSCFALAGLLTWRDWLSRGASNPSVALGALGPGHAGSDLDEQHGPHRIEARPYEQRQQQQEEGIDETSRHHRAAALPPRDDPKNAMQMSSETEGMLPGGEIPELRYEQVSQEDIIEIEQASDSDRSQQQQQQQQQQEEEEEGASEGAAEHTDDEGNRGSTVAEGGAAAIGVDTGKQSALERVRARLRERYGDGGDDDDAASPSANGAHRAASAASAVSASAAAAEAAAAVPSGMGSRSRVGGLPRAAAAGPKDRDAAVIHAWVGAPPEAAKPHVEPIKAAKKRKKAPKPAAALERAAEGIRKARGDGLQQWLDGLFTGKDPGGAPDAASLAEFLNSRAEDEQAELQEQQQGPDRHHQQHQQHQQHQGDPGMPKVPNSAWRHFSTPEYDDARRRCFGAPRPWLPATEVPESLTTLGAAGGGLWGRRLSGRLLQRQTTRNNSSSSTNSTSRRSSLRQKDPVRSGGDGPGFGSFRRRLKVARITTSLVPFCKSREREFRQRLPEGPLTLSPAREALAACLRSDKGCLGADMEAVGSQASALSGIRALRSGPKDRCFLATSSGQCSKLEKNPETGDPAAYLRAAAKDYPLRHRADRDLQSRQFPSCALVSNGPLTKVAMNGDAVDAHESVWRFNLMAGAKAHGPWSGTKTSVRVFNRLRGIEAAGIREGRNVKLKVDDHEQWLFWSAASSVYISDIKRRYPKVRTGLLHGTLVAWMLKVYFLLRQDLAELGLGGFTCPENLSSGIHSAFLATQVCDRTNLFGFSYSSEVLRTRPGHMDKHHTMHSAHSWEFDVLVIRLLHLAGDVNICTADDPSLDLKSLRKGLTDRRR